MAEVLSSRRDHVLGLPGGVCPAIQVRDGAQPDLALRIGHERSESEANRLYPGAS